MTTNGEAAPKPRRSRRVLVGILVIAVLGAAGYVVYDKVIKKNDNDGQVTGAAGYKFTLNFPSGWTPQSQKQLEKHPGKPIAVIRQDNGKGFVVLRGKGPAPATFDTFSGDLKKELKKLIPDFQEQSSKTVKIKAGKAFFYSYIRKNNGTVHTVVVVPAGNKSFEINAVSAGKEKKVAKQIANMILSFNNK